MGDAEEWVRAMVLLEKNKTFTSLYKGSKYSGTGDMASAVKLTGSLVKVKKEVRVFLEGCISMQLLFNIEWCTKGVALPRTIVSLTPENHRTKNDPKHLSHGTGTAPD